MSNSELIRLAEQFEKEAGTLKYPAKTFNDMRDWCRSVIATRALNVLDSKISKIRPPRPGMSKGQAKAIRQKIVEFRLLRKELIKIIRDSGFQQEVSGPSVTNNFQIDSDVLPYKEPSEERKDDRDLQVGIQVMFTAKGVIPTEYGHKAFYSRNDSPAFYLPGARLIVIDASDYQTINSVDSLHSYMSQLATAVRHELQHAVQFQIPLLKWHRGEVQHPMLNESGPFGQGPKGQRTPWDEDEETPHELKAIEFYTRLSDDLKEFRACKSHIPLVYSRPALYYWIGQLEYQDFREHVMAGMITRASPHGSETVEEFTKLEDEASNEFRRLREVSRIAPSSFFLYLKHYNEQAYKKAVKEFVKEVGAVL